jgi:hypothetical protein
VRFYGLRQERLAYMHHRVIDIRGMPNLSVDMTVPEFEPAFEALWKGGSITCKTTGNTLPPLPRPTVAIFDVNIFLISPTKITDENVI